MELPSRNTPVGRCETLSAFTQHALRSYIRILSADAAVGARLDNRAERVGSP
jgi:hypothetical protein